MDHPCSRAVLVRNHGVFTIGANARDAVKAVVMCEDVARTVHLARQRAATAAEQTRLRAGDQVLVHGSPQADLEPLFSAE